jgi:hypothetical protein
MDSICGVLLLNGNKTFGKSGKRLLYRFVADDKTLPMLLVPYELKLGFSKDVKNKYVIVRRDNTDVGEHPIGIILETIGDVDCLSAYYEYRLHCRGVHDSISKFTNAVRQLPSGEPTVGGTFGVGNLRFPYDPSLHPPTREGVRGNRRFPLNDIDT